MTSAWELISTERQGQAGRRAIVAKTFRMPDGSQAVFTVTGDASSRAVACLALTPRQTAVLAGQYRPGPERVMTELPGGGVEPGETLAGGAARELTEETGYVPEELIYLGEMCYGRPAVTARPSGTPCCETRCSSGWFCQDPGHGYPINWPGRRGREGAMATGDGIAVFPALDALVTRMEAGLARLEEQQDPRRFFHDTYTRTTRAVGAELKRGGFLDPGWVERWDVAFARFYLDALETSMQGGHVPGPWAAAFGAGTVPPLRHVLLGMNAHINYDLPQALLAVVSDAEFDDQALLTRREADHRHIDQVLAELVDRGSGLGWANRLATKRFLAEARAKVWVNTSALAAARRQGALEARLGELERLATAKVAELTRPGPVLLRLAVRGFGVTLPDKKGDR